jgi:hypothetical protein
VRERDIEESEDERKIDRMLERKKEMSVREVKIERERELGFKKERVRERPKEII